MVFIWELERNKYIIVQSYYLCRASQRVRSVMAPLELWQSVGGLKVICTSAWLLHHRYGSLKVNWKAVSLPLNNSLQRPLKQNRVRREF